MRLPLKRTCLLAFAATAVAGMAGCADFANTRNFAAVGTLVGAGAGVALGAATGHVAEGVMIGAGAGTLLGGVTGSQFENMNRKKAEKALLQGVEQDMLTGKTRPATATGPGHWEEAKKSRWVDTSQKKRVWVEEKVVDGKVIEAHFEERLIPAGHWVEDEEKVWVEDTQARSALKP
jgi:hypothetical protein